VVTFRIHKRAGRTSISWGCHEAAPSTTDRAGFLLPAAQQAGLPRLRQLRVYTGGDPPSAWHFGPVVFGVLPEMQAASRGAAGGVMRLAGQHVLSLDAFREAGWEPGGGPAGVAVDWGRLLAALGLTAEQSQYLMAEYLDEPRPRWRRDKLARLARMVKRKLAAFRRRPAADLSGALVVLQGSPRTGSVLVRSDTGGQWWELR